MDNKRNNQDLRTWEISSICICPKNLSFTLSYICPKKARIIHFLKWKLINLQSYSVWKMKVSVGDDGTLGQIPMEKSKEKKDWLAWKLEPRTPSKALNHTALCEVNLLLKEQTILPGVTERLLTLLPVVRLPGKTLTLVLLEGGQFSVFWGES